MSELPPEIAAELGPCADIDSGQTCRKRYRKSSIWCENCVRTEAAVATLRAVATDLEERSYYRLFGALANRYRKIADRIERGEI